MSKDGDELSRCENCKHWTLEVRFGPLDDETTGRCSAPQPLAYRASQNPAPVEIEDLPRIAGYRLGCPVHQAKKPPTEYPII